MNRREGRPAKHRTAPKISTRAAADTHSLRLGCPMGCPLDHHEPPCPAAVPDGTGAEFSAPGELSPAFQMEQLQKIPHCDVCLSFDYGERERLETCRDDRRCPLARNIIGGGQR